MRKWMTLLTIVAVAGMFASPWKAEAFSPKVKLSIAVGPPTTVTKAVGSGFPMGNSISITFDGATVASTGTSSTGTFKVAFTVPASATPGVHTVEAVDNQGPTASTSFTVQTNWPSARFSPGQTGVNIYENVLTESTVGHISQTASPQWGGVLHSEPIYYSGLLVVGSSDGTVREFTATGSQNWSFSAGGAILGSPLAIIPKLGQAACAIVAGSADGNVYGLNPTNGSQLWSFSMGAPISGSPVALQSGPGQGGVIVADNGAVTAFDGCTGGVLWSHGSTGSNQAFTPAVLSHITLSNGTTQTAVVVGPSGETVYEDKTGRLLWRMPGPIGSPSGFGSGSGGRIVISDGGTLKLQNAGTGAVLWSDTFPSPISGTGILETLSPASGKLVVSGILAGDSAGDLASLNPKTGAEQWGITLSGGGAISNMATESGGVILLTEGPANGNDGMLLALNGSDGTQLFSADTADLNPQPYPPAPPTVADGRVYVGDFTGGLRVFGLAAG